MVTKDTMLVRLVYSGIRMVKLLPSQTRLAWISYPTPQNLIYANLSIHLPNIAKGFETIGTTYLEREQ